MFINLSLRIARFLDFVHQPEFEIARTKLPFGNRISFCLQERRRRHLLCWGPSEKADLLQSASLLSPEDGNRFGFEALCFLVI
jgi:hypothetical protein